MVQRLPENKKTGSNALLSVLWSRVLKMELDAAEHTGYIPNYLRTMYHKKFPIAASDLAYHCNICFDVFSNVNNKLRHLKDHHESEKPRLEPHFRRAQRPGRGIKQVDFNCIICGFKSPSVKKVIYHIQRMHDRYDQVLFNVSWLVDLYGQPKEFSWICDETHSKVTPMQVAEHGLKCRTCNPVRTLVTCVEQCCETFYAQGKEDENLTYIGQATELLHGFEKLAKTTSLFDLV